MSRTISAPRESEGGPRSTFPFAFSAAICRELEAIGVSQSLPPAGLLLGVFQELLRRYTDRDRVTVGFHHEKGQSLSVLDDNSSSRTIALRSLDAGHQRLASEEATVLDGQLLVSGGGVSPGLHAEGAVSALVCTLRHGVDGLDGFLNYDPEIWGDAIVGRFCRSYQTLLRAALHYPDSPLNQLEILDEAEARELLAWNQTHREYPSLCVDQLFEQQALRVPDHPAVTCDGKTLSYRLLCERAARLAKYLRAKGVGPGSLVGICMDRGSEMIVALLAIFRTGAAYLPLDPAFPADRIVFMQRDADPLAVITHRHLLRSLPLSAPHVLCADSEDDLSAAANLDVGAPAEACPVRDLDQAAYVLYTSGSSGKPKGVTVTHRALTNLITGVSEELRLGSTDVLLATTTISFDISAFEIFAPLAAGAHLVVGNRALAADGEALSDTIRKSGASIFQATPSGWRILLEAGWSGQPGLKMLTAGEPLHRTLAERLLQRGESLWNLYGPTEASIYATGTRIFKDQRITIGKPLGNYTAYVLDRQARRLPVGAIGELYLGGVGIARGYLNRPELTAEKFVPDPFDSESGRRLYRTGDLARFLPDGDIDLLGRADNQVKLRGYRIELEEIEALLDSHPAVQRSVVRLVDVGEDDHRLIAYISPQASDPISEKELLAYAQRTLPPYMVPSLFVPVRSFALTPSGKVDRKALPVPADLNELQAGILPASQMSNLEQTVLECWQATLRLPHLALNDNFFEAGGHSLLAVRMCSELGGKLGSRVPASWLIESPTASAFAQRLRNAGSVSLACCLVKLQPAGSLPPLYLIHHLLGDIFIYREMARHFAPERPVYGIEPPVDFLERRHPYSLAALAGEYVSELVRHQPVGPFHLGGYSSGSVIAFEMARQLTESGHQVGLLALIDGDIRTPEPVLPLPIKYAKSLARKLCKVVFKARDEFSEGPKVFVSKRIGYLSFLWHMRNLQKEPAGEGREITLEQALSLCERAYRPQPYSGSALLLRFRDEAWKYGPNPLMGWTGLMAEGINAIDVPGAHMNGMHASRAPRLARLLKDRLDTIEASASNNNAHTHACGR